MLHLNKIVLGPHHIIDRINSSISAAANILIDASTEKIAYRFMASTTSGITAVACNWAITGSPGVFKIGVFAETASSGTCYPDTANQLGGYTGNINAPATTGWIAMTDLSSATGNLTVGSFYWIVVEYVSGTLDGSNYIQANRFGGSFAASWVSQAIRHHNGTNWTTTSAVEMIPLVCVKHADNTYSGNIYNAPSSWTVNDIYTASGSAQVQGIQFKVGAQVKIAGVAFAAVRSGTPNEATWTLYQGDTSKASGSLAFNAFQTNAYNQVYFTTPVLVDANATLYLLLSNTNTSASNYYRLSRYNIQNDAWVSAAIPNDWRGVSGTLGTPSSLTVNTSSIVVPAVCPIIFDPASDFDEGTGGGSSPRFGDMTGGLR